MKKYIILLITFLIVIQPFYFVRAEETYDTVILNGNIYDPLTEITYKNYNIGITTGKITAITRDAITGVTTIDATDKYIIPSFIDTFNTPQNENIDALRIKDGVTTTVFKSDLPLEKYILQENKPISYINRVMLFDITSSFNPDAHKDKLDEFIANIKDRLSEGYAGLYYKPDALTKMPDLSEIDSKYPLFLDFFNMGDEDIIPWLDKFNSQNKEKRNLVVVGANYFYESLDNLIGFSDDNENVFLGGYPFSYVNIRPKQLSDSKFNKLVGKVSINQNRFNVFKIDNSYKSIDETIAVLGVNKENIIDKILNSSSFLSQTFNHFETERIQTSDINTFVGRLFLTYDKKNPDLNKILKTINSQTNLVRNVFGNDSIFKSKGIIEIGADADLLITEPEKITPYSSMTEEMIPSSGIDLTMRNGYVIYDGKTLTTIAPKANYIKIEEPFYQSKEVELSTKGKKKEMIKSLIYNNSNYISSETIANYLKIKYEVDRGVFYLGSIIRLEIGNNDFTIGTNKVQLQNEPLIINGGYYISERDLNTIFKDYFDVNIDESKINFTPGKMVKLLDKEENNENSINVSLNSIEIFKSYIIALLLIILFIILLNRSRIIRKLKGEK